MLSLASIIPAKRFRPEALMRASGTGGSVSLNNVAGYPRMDDRVAIFQVHCSERELGSLKNIRKDRKKPITREGSGKNREEGEKLWEQKGPMMVEDVTKIIEEHDILYMQGNNTAGGGTSGPLEPALVAEVLSQGIVGSGVLQSILPRLNEDPVILQNALQCIRDTHKLVEAGDIHNWILIQNGRIAKNDVDFKNTDLNIARVEEIILRSLIIQSNPFDVSDYFGDQMLRSKSPKYRISTKGYARKQLNRRHNGAFAGEYIEDLTVKVINDNWLGADLAEQCRRAYIVIRADPKHMDENNRDMIQNVAQNILPKTSVTVAKYPVNRSQTIEIAALFIGIKTKIMQDYTARLSEIVPEEEQEEEESGSVWESLGFEHNPNAEMPGGDVQ